MVCHGTTPSAPSAQVSTHQAAGITFGVPMRLAEPYM